jgi:hypothetical protein
MKSMMRLAMTVLMFSAVTCHAAVVQFSFDGVVTFVQQRGTASVLGVFPIGGPVSGVLTYRTNATSVGSSTFGQYTFNDPTDAAYGLSILAGGYTFTALSRNS